MKYAAFIVHLEGHRNFYFMAFGKKIFAVYFKDVSLFQFKHNEIDITEVHENSL